MKRYATCLLHYIFTENTKYNTFTSQYVIFKQLMTLNVDCDYTFFYIFQGNVPNKISCPSLNKFNVNMEECHCFIKRWRKMYDVQVIKQYSHSVQQTKHAKNVCIKFCFVPNKFLSIVFCNFITAPFLLMVLYYVLHSFVNIVHLCGSHAKLV